jgi:hypothetical protein
VHLQLRNNVYRHQKVDGVQRRRRPLSVFQQIDAGHIFSSQFVGVHARLQNLQTARIHDQHGPSKLEKNPFRSKFYHVQFNKPLIGSLNLNLIPAKAFKLNGF